MLIVMEPHNHCLQHTMIHSYSLKMSLEDPLTKYLFITSVLDQMELLLMFGVSIHLLVIRDCNFYCFIDRHVLISIFKSSFRQFTSLTCVRSVSVSSIYRNKYTCARCVKHVQHWKNDFITFVWSDAWYIKH